MSCHSNISNGSRLVIIGPFPPPVHGMAMINLAISQMVSERGVYPIVIDTSAGKPIETFLSRFSRVPRILRGWFRLLLHVKHYSDGAVYLSVSGGVGQIYELLFILTARVFGWRTILHHHSYAYLDHSRFLTRCLIRTAGISGTHVVLCEAMGAQLKKCYQGVHDIAVLSNISFIERQYSGTGSVKTGLCRVGFLSNISESKGIIDFLDVAEKLENSPAELEFFIAGVFANKEVEERVIARLKNLKKTNYLGPLYGEEKREFFGTIDILLFPTKYFNEAEPVTIYEALCSGVPVIARGRGCIASILNSDYGLVIDPQGDFVSLAVNKILIWYESPDVFSAASEAALEYAERKKESQKDQMESLCRTLAGIT